MFGGHVAGARGERLSFSMVIRNSNDVREALSDALENRP
jgi:hypothetical protein